MHFVIKEIKIFSHHVCIFIQNNNCQIRLKTYLNNRPVKAFRVCFIGTGLCKILVIVTLTILESFQIIIHYKLNFNSKLFCCSLFLHPFNVFVYLYFIIFLHSFNVFFWSICILLWTYSINQTLVNILPTKSRM